MSRQVFALVRKLPNRARLEAGFGMIELVAAMTVLSVGVLALFAMFQSGMLQIQRASAVTTAAALADSEMEGFRAIKYESIGLADADVAATDAVYKGDSAYRGDASTSLSSGIVTTTATTVEVTSAAGFPTTPPFRIQIDSEMMFVVAGAGTNTWTVVRGVSGTVATVHAAGAAVTLKARVHLPNCGVTPCTNAVPTKTVVGADKKSYRLDTFVTWTVATNQDGTPGRNVKLVTMVVRDSGTGRTLARVGSTFDESTGV